MSNKPFLQQFLRYVPLTMLFMLFLFLACKKEKAEAEVAKIDTIPTLVMQIQKCSKLYTAECKMHKIITHDDKVSLHGKFMETDYNIDLPVGSRKVAIPMDATIKAYIDFSSFSEASILRNGDKLNVVLPDPKVQLTSTSINHEEVKQFVALTRSRFTDEELTNYEQQGRKAIIADIPQTNIVEQARESAARILIPMFVQMGFKEADITVSFRKDFNKNNIGLLLENNTAGK